MAVLFPELRSLKKKVVQAVRSESHRAWLKWRLRKAGVTASLTLKPAGFTKGLELFNGTPDALQKQVAKQRTKSGLATRWLIYPACTQEYVLPKTIEPDDAAKFGPWKIWKRPPYYTYRLPRTLYHGRSGACVDAEQHIFLDLLDWGAKGSEKLLGQEKKEAHFCRNAGVLSSSKNYYHWLIKMLPRLHLMERIEMPPSAFDALLIEWPTLVQKDAYLHSGLSSYALRVVSSRDFWYCRNLFVTNVPHECPSWAVEYLRKLFAPLIVPTDGRPKAIYLARGKTKWRRVCNEPEVSEWLQSRGIGTVDFGTCSFEDQVRIIAAADIIIAPHGAALANIVFAKNGTRVLEIFASPKNQKCYWMLADHRRLIYHYFMAECIDTSHDPNRWDLMIPLEKLERALDHILEDRGRWES